MSYKGKEVAGKGSAGVKRKRNEGDGKRSGGRNPKDRGVLKFFEDEAEFDDYESDDSEFDDDFLDEMLDMDQKAGNVPWKENNLPLFPKEEQFEEEFDRMMEERYAEGSGFVSYAINNNESNRSGEGNSLVRCAKDPTIWKVKCMVGRERHSAFCLMQKFVDLKSLGTKLQIISAFSLEHIKGFIYIEADKHIDIMEACKGICNIYATRVAQVPLNDVSHLLSVRSKCPEVSIGMWARVKNGNYKGDLAEVVAVNNVRKRATVKLIPRVDLQAMAQKYGGGLAAKRGVIPAPRLISSRELEEFRPLIQHRRDRDTGKNFEVLDGLMLKDGYLYKKVSLDSLSWAVTPSDEELLKFKHSGDNESEDLEWLAQLYGDREKKKVIESDKGSAKGEGSSTSGAGDKGGISDKGFAKGEGSSSFAAGDDHELYNLVCFGRKDFGLILGKEKDDSYKILTEGKEGQSVVTVEQRTIKKGPSDMKFTALDQHMKAVSVGDTVRVLEGPLKERQGVIKQIYRGTIFMYDETETENGGYFCARSQVCEKVKNSFDEIDGKAGESGDMGFENFPSSPKSPLSPKKPWQERESNSSGFNQGDTDNVFSIGQSLRIRIGPLKGYLCRVLAMRRSDVTVKLDSQQKILTVKCEHLSEVREKTTTISSSEGAAGTNSLKPLDQLGTEGSSGGWNVGTGTSTESGGWNTGAQSTETSDWPSSQAASQQNPTECDPNNPSGAANKEVEDSAWGVKKVTQESTSSWGKTAVDVNTSASKDEAGASEISAAAVGSGWGASDGWGKATASGAGAGSGAAASWGKSAVGNDSGGQSSDKSWGKGQSLGDDAVAGRSGPDSWGSKKDTVEAGSWGKNKGSDEQCWDKGKDVKDDEPIWGAKKTSSEDGNVWTNSAFNNQSHIDTWNKPKAIVDEGGSSWNNKQGGESKQDVFSSWGSLPIANSATVDGGGSSWNKPKAIVDEGGSAWNKPKAIVDEGGSSWNKQGGESKPDVGSSWGSQPIANSATVDGGGSSWNKQGGQSKTDVGSSWGSQPAANTDDESKKGGWNSSAGGNQGSGWANKSNWNSGNSGQDDKNDDQAGGFGGRGRGGFGGRGDSDRGGFRGRGDRGGFRGRGRFDGGGDSSDGGGFGGRGGGFGGRGRFGGGGDNDSGGGGGGSCYSCGESGHMSRDCPSGGRGGGRGGGGGSCYSCGESGHMSRDCPSGGSGGRGGGRGGGGSCYSCGESGHMSRDCPSGGSGGRGGGRGGGGGSCYSCGESGHMSRDCPSGGRGGGRGGGGGGGGSCYKCGESGHFARECTSNNDTAGGGSWKQEGGNGGSVTKGAWNSNNDTAGGGSWKQGGETKGAWNSNNDTAGGGSWSKKNEEAGGGADKGNWNNWGAGSASNSNAQGSGSGSGWN